MKKITLFVGDCDTSIARIANQFDQTAVLIDYNNYEYFLSCEHGYTGYTSLADLPKDLSVIYRLLNQADCVFYHPPECWSDGKTIDTIEITDSMHGVTELILYNIAIVKNNVVGLDLKKFNPNLYLPLVDTRRSDLPQLWIAGCSTSLGVGVSEHERYGYLLGKFLNLPVSFLTATGSSISWVADQILRSDLRANDIVVWGLTEENRLTFWDPKFNKTVHVNSTYTHAEKINLSKNIINRLKTHTTNFVTAVQKVYEIVNFCRKTNVTLLIINIHSTDTVNIHLQNLKEFFKYSYPLTNGKWSIHNSFVDLGTDGEHPGPLQHKLYADFCQSALKKLNYI